MKFPAYVIVVLNLVVALVFNSVAFAKGRPHWVGTWATPPVAQPALAQPPGLTSPAAFSNQTLRLVVHTSIGGHVVRVRLSNAFGTQPLAIGAAHIALRNNGAAIVPASDRTLTFGGAKSANIWAGAPIVSDPVELDVPALGDLAVSIYLPGDVPASLPITYHSIAKQTNYISPAGDYTASTEMPVSATKLSWYFLTGVEVMAPEQTGAVVAIGDSLTDANLSTPDTNHRWPDELARRLEAQHGGHKLGVLNEGTGGGRVLHDGNGESGLHRFDRDVLAETGVTHVIVFLGINDIRSRNAAEAVTADDMIAGYKQLILRAHGRGIKIFGATLLPFENENFTPGAYTPEGEAKRQAVNAWIRSSGAFDAVIDFEKTLRDPSHPTSMLPKYDCGDHLHPNDLGYQALGDSIDLSLFK
jgi:lysophospholipase L1-like esterase